MLKPNQTVSTALSQHKTEQRNSLYSSFADTFIANIYSGDSVGSGWKKIVHPLYTTVVLCFQGSNYWSLIALSLFTKSSVKNHIVYYISCSKWMFMLFHYLSVVIKQHKLLYLTVIIYLYTLESHDRLGQRGKEGGWYLFFWALDDTVLCAHVTHMSFETN